MLPAHSPSSGGDTSQSTESSQGRDAPRRTWQPVKRQAGARTSAPSALGAAAGAARPSRNGAGGAPRPPELEEGEDDGLPEFGHARCTDPACVRSVADARAQWSALWDACTTGLHGTRACRNNLEEALGLRALQVRHHLFAAAPLLAAGDSAGTARQVKAALDAVCAEGAATDATAGSLAESVEEAQGGSISVAGNMELTVAEARRLLDAHSTLALKQARALLDAAAKGPGKSPRAAGASGVDSGRLRQLEVNLEEARTQLAESKMEVVSLRGQITGFQAAFAALGAGQPPTPPAAEAADDAGGADGSALQEGE